MGTLGSPSLALATKPPILKLRQNVLVGEPQSHCTHSLLSEDVYPNERLHVYCTGKLGVIGVAPSWRRGIS